MTHYVEIPLHFAAYSGMKMIILLGDKHLPPVKVFNVWQNVIVIPPLF
jgi:hypothetical protein